MLRFLILALVSSFSYAQYSASSTYFVPTPIPLDLTDRISTGVGFDPAPNIELEIAYLYKVWDGFDLGLGLHGGVTGQTETGGILGTDVLLRYVRLIGNSFFMGVQTQAGYTYTGLGSSSTLNYSSAFPVTMGLVLGGIVHDAAQIYFFPAVELGQTMKDGDPLWKSGLGMRFTLGVSTTISDGVSLVIETKPVLSNLATSGSVWKTFRIAAFMGLVFDF